MFVIFIFATGFMCGALFVTAAMCNALKKMDDAHE